MNENPNDEHLIEELVRVSESPLDPNAVAARAGGARHGPGVDGLTRDPEAALLVRRWQQEHARRRHVAWGSACIAACLLVGVVAWVLRADRASDPMTPSARLTAAVATLRREQSDLFGQFQLTPDVELTAQAAGTRRGGPVWLHPHGTVLVPPTTFKWRAPIAATRVRVTVEGNGTSWKRESEDESMDAPALGPGRYVVTLRATDGFSQQPTRWSFAIATDQERTQYERARSTLEQKTPADVRDLIEAHYALSLGYLEAAEAAATRASAAGGFAAERAAPMLAHLRR